MNYERKRLSESISLKLLKYQLRAHIGHDVKSHRHSTPPSEARLCNNLGIGGLYYKPVGPVAEKGFNEAEAWERSSR